MHFVLFCLCGHFPVLTFNITTIIVSPLVVKLMSYNINPDVFSMCQVLIYFYSTSSSKIAVPQIPAFVFYFCLIIP